MKLITNAGGRTFSLTVGAGLVTSVLVWFGKIDGSAYSTIVLGTVGAYIAANAVQKVAEARANGANGIAVGTPAPVTSDTPKDAD